MGFNKRYIDYRNSLIALNTSGLKNYYGKSDALLFNDIQSSLIYDLFLEGKTDKQILKKINEQKL